MGDEKQQAGFDKLDAEQLVRRLAASGLDIPDGLVDEILSRGEAAVEPMGKMMLDEELWQARDGRSRGPIHAMHLLGGLGSLKALPYFEELLVPDRNTDYITEAMASILAAHGPDAVESLERIASNRIATEYNRSAAVRALCLIAYRRPETKPEAVRILRKFFAEGADEDPSFLNLIADDLAGLKDPQAKEDLRSAIEQELIHEYWITWEDIERIYASREETASIAHDDTDPMDYFSEEAGIRSQDRARSSRPSRAERKIGRNDPCPCNNGKKYKKCCGR